jgi:mevalonate kinase
MDRPITVSAPGKLFLIGEYAVLEGAPALLTAVDTRAKVGVAPDTRWRICAPALGINDLELDACGELPSTLDATTRAKLSVFDAVRAVVAQHLGQPPVPLAVHIETREFVYQGHKLGLGSSAAVAAALAQALIIATGARLPREALAKLAIDAHRAAQNGTGSGGDVAASIFGGTLSYTYGQAPVPLAWPASLAGLAVVTGQGASTLDMVARVRAYAAQDAQGYAADIATLRQLAGSAQQALTESGRFLHLAQGYFEALTALDRHAAAGIVSQRHGELHRLAARHSALFKTSGAGGGDAGLVFVLRGRDETALRSAFAAAGAEILALAFGAPGVRIEDDHLY